MTSALSNKHRFPLESHFLTQSQIPQMKHVKTPLVILASNVGTCCILAASLSIQLSANEPGKTEEDGPSVWIISTHVGDPDQAPCFILAHCWPSWPCGGVNESVCISLSLSPLTVPGLQIKIPFLESPRLCFSSKLFKKITTQQNQAHRNFRY